MTTTLGSIIYPTSDAEEAKKVMTALFGKEPEIDQPYYVGYEVDGRQVGLDPNGAARGMTGPVPYWNVPDIDATIAALEAAGATVTQAPTDVGGGNLIATLTDADGNTVGLSQAP